MRLGDGEVGVWEVKLGCRCFNLLFAWSVVRFGCGRY